MHRASHRVEILTYPAADMNRQAETTELLGHCAGNQPFTNRSCFSLHQAHTAMTRLLVALER